MRMRTVVAGVLSAGLVVLSSSAWPQSPPRYGAPISAEDAKKVAASAVAEARKNGWTMAIAITDPAGNLVYFERMDDTQFASTEIAIAKARTAAAYRRPSKAFQDGLAGGNTGVLALPGVLPTEGGIPLMAEGGISGAIGVSGGAAQQDGVVAQAGAAAVR
jgi:glc operon protein GlcG